MASFATSYHLKRPRSNHCTIHGFQSSTCTRKDHPVKPWLYSRTAGARPSRIAPAWYGVSCRKPSWKSFDIETRMAPIGIYCELCFNYRNKTRTQAVFWWVNRNAIEFLDMRARGDHQESRDTISPMQARSKTRYRKMGHLGHISRF